MNYLSQVVDWLRDSANWAGSMGIPHRLAEHVEMSLAAVVFSLLIAVPLGVWLGHKRRFGLLAINVSNVGRAIPSFAILVVGSQLLNTRIVPIVGTWFVFIALVVMAVPPMVTNSYVGMAEVPDDVRDAARGMGLSERQALFGAELPLAVPLIMAGIRTAAVQVVATATIAAYVGVGGLGRYIVDGYAEGPNQTGNEPSGYAVVFAGALLVALLALVTEGLFAVLQRAVTAEGLKRQTKAEEGAVVTALPGAATTAA